MGFSRSLNAVFLLAALATVGLLMVWVPSQIVQHYQVIKEFGRLWVILYFVVVGTGGLLLAGTSSYVLYTLWWRGRKKKLQRDRSAKNPSELTAAERQQEYAENLQAIEALQNDPHTSAELKETIQPLLARLERKRTQEKLEIVAFGTISSGKSSLLNALAGRDIFSTDLKGGTTIVRQEMPWHGKLPSADEDRLILVDTPGLAEIAGASHVAIAAEAARDADVVLMVVDGPLRDSEHSLLTQLGAMEKKIIVCLNKNDWYNEQDRHQLLSQVGQQTAPFVEPENILAVRSQATTRTRLRVTSTGDEMEEQVPVPADIAALAERMLELVRREGQDMLLANLLLQSRGLVEEAKQKAQAAIDRRAWELVDRYTWGAGGAAALSPTPVLDLLAGSAITTKMVIDLAAVYKQDVDLKLALELLGQLGKNLIGILGVSAAAPAVTSAVASLLKTVPGAGTIAGGLLQGVVQALITRWIGAVFVEYFRLEMHAPPGGLASLARRQWQFVTSAVEMKKFLSEARENLLGQKQK
jgi:uncharacterized protein